jgi:cob(I)alamin adenosyltransferase
MGLIFFFKEKQMSLGEIQTRLFAIQSDLEEIQEELNETGAPDFDRIKSDIDDAEIEWNEGRYQDAYNGLEEVKDAIDEELKNVGDLDARETIINWITDMPVGAFMDLKR